MSYSEAHRNLGADALPFLVHYSEKFSPGTGARTSGLEEEDALF